MATTFPSLYGEALSGKQKVWALSVEDRGGVGAIVISHGYEDGKKQVIERLVSVGKNIGKKNETTPVQQAVSEAQALWNKKKDAGYTTNAVATANAVGGAGTSESEVAATTTAATATAAAPLPMLAHDYNKRGKDIKFPCYAQKKLDGVRCVAIAGKGLFSRNGKEIGIHLKHIRDALSVLPTGSMLDGELYSHDLSFQQVVGLVKKETLDAGDAERLAKIHLCVYDTILLGKTNKDRKKWLEGVFGVGGLLHGHGRGHGNSVTLLETYVCNSLSDAKMYHAAFVAQGYEGLILRNVHGLYCVGHRSIDLQKYKEFLDDEFKIVGFKEGDGLEKGCVIWRCVTKDGASEFDCRPRGTREERAALFVCGASQIGKKLSVRFQEWTDEGKPRFPVGIAIRDYE